MILTRRSLCNRGATETVKKDDAITERRVWGPPLIKRGHVVSPDRILGYIHARTGILKEFGSVILYGREEEGRKYFFQLLKPQVSETYLLKRQTLHTPPLPTTPSLGRNVTDRHVTLMWMTASPGKGWDPLAGVLELMSSRTSLPVTWLIKTERGICSCLIFWIVHVCWQRPLHETLSSMRPILLFYSPQKACHYYCFVAGDPNLRLLFTL